MNGLRLQPAFLPPLDYARSLLLLLPAGGIQIVSRASGEALTRPGRLPSGEKTAGDKVGESSLVAMPPPKRFLTLCADIRNRIVRESDVADEEMVFRLRGWGQAGVGVQTPPRHIASLTVESAAPGSYDRTAFQCGGITPLSSLRFFSSSSASSRLSFAKSCKGPGMDRSFSAWRCQVEL